MGSALTGRGPALAGALLAVLVPLWIIVFAAGQSAALPPGAASGLGPFLVRVLGTALAALAMAVPIGGGAALFAARLAPRWARPWLGAVLDVLASVPAPGYVLLVLPTLFSTGPVVTVFLVAVLVAPVIASLSREILRQVPAGQVEASLALGATGWEAVRQVVLPFSARALTGTLALAGARALAEALTPVGLSVALDLRPGQEGWVALPPSRAELWRLVGNTGSGSLARLVVACLLLMTAVAVLGPLGRAVRAGAGWVPRPRWHRGRAVAGPPSRAAELNRALDASLTGARLPRWASGALALGCLLLIGLLDALAGGVGSDTTLLGTACLTYLLYHHTLVSTVEGPRAAADASCRDLCAAAFALLVLPLAELLAVALDDADLLPDLPATAGSILPPLAAAAAVSVPVGLACAGWACVHAGRRGARAARALADAAVSAPPLVSGLAALALAGLLVGPAHAPGPVGLVLALGAVMIPHVVAAATVILDLVPAALCEEGLALGADRGQVLLRVVLPSAAQGLVPAVTLALSRAAGASGLLLVVAGGATGRQASATETWTGVLFLLAVVAVLDLAGRIMTARLGPRHGR